MPNSSDLAHDPSLFAVWDPDAIFPAYEEMEDLSVVTHVIIERAREGGFHYLHESAIAMHRGTLFVCWANHPTHEVNTVDELIRGRRSVDGGLTWSAVETWVEAAQHGGVSFNHPVLFAHEDKLWGFIGRWDKDVKKPRTEILLYNDDTGKWETTGKFVPNFLGFRPPTRMPDGNWIISGEDFWYEAAVAISDGDDLTSWRLVQIPRPETVELLYPETALLDQGDRMIALCRPRNAPTSPASVSTDCGQTWTPLTPSNFPLAESQPYSGTLSTGQHYLLTCSLEENRGLLSIAVTEPGGRLFKQIWKVRHQHYPKRRVFGGYAPHPQSMVGHMTEWSYPAAVEHDGKLYISYTQGKEDCVLSIVPLTSLAVTQ